MTKESRFLLMNELTHWAKEEGLAMVEPAQLGLQVPLAQLTGQLALRVVPAMQGLMGQLAQLVSDIPGRQVNKQAQLALQE
jgi:hypothetical protein